MFVKFNVRIFRHYLKDFLRYFVSFLHNICSVLYAIFYSISVQFLVPLFARCFWYFMPLCSIFVPVLERFLYIFGNHHSFDFVCDLCVQFLNRTTNVHKYLKKWLKIEKRLKFYKNETINSTKHRKTSQ